MVEFQTIFSNITLILSLTFIYILFIPQLRRYSKPTNSLIIGVLFGIFTMLVMNDPIRMSNGGIIDIRHVIVMCATMISGYGGGLIAAIIASAYRAYLGNPGMLPGIASVITAFAIGAAHYRIMQGKLTFNRYTIAVGLLIPFSPLVWLVTMSGGVGWEALPRVAPAILTLYPIATYMLIWLLSINNQRMELMNTVWQFEQRQDALFQQTPTLLIGIKPNGTVVSINPSALNFLGMAEADVLNKNTRNIDWGTLPTTIQTSFINAFRQAVTGERVRQTLQFGEDSDAVFMDVWFIPIVDMNENITLILIEGNDISNELRMKEKELELNFANQRNELLTQLIGDVAHHLRTPLSVISSSSYLLKRRLENAVLANDEREKVDESLGKIANAQTSLNELVDDLLKLMQLEAIPETSFEPTDFANLVYSVTEKYHTIATEKNVQLIIDTQSGELPVLLAKTELQRVIENLVENGLRYTPEGGTVTIRVAQQNGEALLEVKDTGIGIPADEISSIFDRFYRAKNAKANDKKGTGLGLAIVKKAVTLHNGQIDVQSQPDIGTTVIIRLPLHTQSNSIAM